MSAAEESWPEYRRLVLQGLKDLTKDVENLNEKVDKMRLQFTVDITTLKVRAGMWGTVGGLVISLVVSFVWNAVFKGK
jgi:hypothetical protein